MNIKRREFLGAALAGAVTAGRAWGQSGSSETAARAVKVEKLYKAPDIHPNALEAADDGLWIADQISEHVAKVDWERSCTRWCRSRTTPVVSPSAAAISG